MEREKEAAIVSSLSIRIATCMALESLPSVALSSKQAVGKIPVRG
jgi:hypothetical protein